MRLWLVLIHIFLVACSVLIARAYEDATIMEDDDFAEFEQFDADEDGLGDTKGFMADNNQGRQQRAQPPDQSEEQFDAADEDDMVVEDEDNEFEHFQDPEEFEGFPSPPAGSGEPKITITKVHPIMLRARWDAYWIEALLCCGLAAYALGYAIGRSRNNAIAATFLKLHKPFLDENFSLVGEKSEQQASSSDSMEGVWRREAEHCYTLWCSGRTCCEGMLLTLKLIKRQDLVHVLSGIVRPCADTLQLKVDLGRDDSDAFVMCVAQKKAASKLAKDMADLSVFCPERRAGDKYGMPSSLQVMSEIAEATAALLDTRVIAALNKFAHLIEYIHISDQYSGAKQIEETNVTKAPETQHVLVMGLLVPCQTEGTEAAVESLRPLLVLTFYLVEKLKRFRLSKEAANKSERNRQRVAEEFVRGTHAARQEQAAARREEKRKQEKERILAEDDPEKQRRWEKKEQKRQLKRKTPKLKQLKVKAL